MKRVLRQWLAGLLSVVLVFALLPATAWAADFDGTVNGSGNSEADPYLIENAEQLAALSNHVNEGNDYSGQYFKLTQDIDLDNQEWTPIGKENTQFKGNFDGGSHTVSGLYIDTRNQYQGLFGYIGDSGTVKNLTVDGKVSGGNNTGGIVGCSRGSLENCHNTATINGGENVGGIAGLVENNGSVKNCSNTGTVNGSRDIGGVGGYINSAIENCYNAGDVSCTGSNAGGVVGFLYGGTVKNCYNTAAVNGTSGVGGIVGNNSRRPVQFCYNYGAITAVGSYGAVVGASSTCTNCYYPTGTVYKRNDGSVEKSAAEFRFLASTLNGGEGEVWADSDAGRPVLVDNQEANVNIIDGDTPYEIPDADTMKAFRDYINDSDDGGEGKTFKLTNDINLGDEEWTPIGNDNDHRFKGTFDGGGYTISGLHIDQSGSSYQGLFGYVESGVIRNLGVTGSVTGSGFVGGIVGSCTSSTIENCHSNVTVKGDSYIGGIAGESGHNDIKNCFNLGNVSGGQGEIYIGGIVGYNYNGNITNCFNCGTVSGSEDSYAMGGIVGYRTSGAVENCYYLNTCGAAGDGTSKEESEFNSGEVAYLLQDEQDTQVWGQTVADGGYPELTASPDKTVYKVTFQSDGTNYDVEYTNPAGLTKLPADPEKEGFTFEGWSKTQGGSVDFTTETRIGADMTVYAVFKEPSSGGDSPTPSTPPDTPVTDPGSDGTTMGRPVTDPASGETTVAVSTSSTTSGSTAKASVSDSAMNRAVDSAVTEAARRGTAPVVEVDVRTSNRADSLNVTLPAAALEELAEAEDSSLVIVSDIADVTLDNTALSALAAQAIGNTVILEVKPVAPSELSEAQADAVDEAPVEELTIVSNGVVIHDYHGGRITVTLPYKLARGQSASDVVVYYLDDDGTLTPCDTSYDSKAEEVTFVTIHLSRYVIGDTALGEEKDCPSEKFTDLDVGAWYHEYTDYVIANGLMRGVDGGLFAPDGTVSRAQMVTVLWNMSGKPVVNYYMTYSDVSEDAWYAEAVRWATSEDIVDGYGNGVFGPNDPITREQMAAMLYRYEQKHGDGGFTGEWMYRLPFTDLDQISDWAFEAVVWCNMEGVITGKDNNVFDPEGPAKRSELAAILTRYLTQNE